MAKKQTYAARAKSIMKKYEPRLGKKFDKGDTLALEAMNAELKALQQEQEQERVRKVQEEQAFQEQAVQQFQDGGKLNKRQQATLSTLLANRNTPFVQQGLQGQPFNPQAGTNALGQPSVGPQQFSGSEQPFIPQGGQDLSQRGIGQNQISFENPRDARQFARRAPRVIDRLPQQGRGGNLPTYQGDNPYTNQLPVDNSLQGGLGLQVNNQFDYSLPPNQGYVDPYAAVNRQFDGVFDPNFNVEGLNRPAGDPNASPFGQAQARADAGGIYGQPGGIDITQQQTNPAGPASLIQRDQGVGNELLNQYQFRAPWMGAAATGLGSILGNRQLELGALEGVEDLEAQQVSPNLVDYSRGRESTKRQRDLTQAEIRGTTRGARTAQEARAATRAGSTAAQRVAGEELNRSVEGQANTNAQIRNQVGMFNAQQRAQTGQTNLRTAMLRGQYERENQLINANRRTNQIAGVTGAIAGYGRDRYAANRDTGFLALEQSDEFPILQQNDSRAKRFFGISADPYKQYIGPNRSLV